MKQCVYCKEPITEGMSFCPNCGAALSAAETAVQPPVAPAAETPAKRKTNGFAVAGFVLGLSSVFCCCLSPIAPILALVFGAVALAQIKHNSDGGKWMAIVAVVLGGVMLLLSVLGFIGMLLSEEFCYDFDLDLPETFDAPYDTPYDGFFDEFNVPMPDFGDVIPGGGKI